METKPPFIIIEGVDRCGKNLQAELLAGKLRAAGLEVEVHSTPDYNGPTGEVIASYLHGLLYLANESCKGARSVHDAMALQCLLVVNRYEVASRVVLALAAGKAVLCVRWKPSALLYGVEDGLRSKFVEDACSMLPEPDLNLLLDLNPSEISERFDKNNRYESDIARQVRLAEAYARYWREKLIMPGGDSRWVKVAASGKAERVGEMIWDRVRETFPAVRVADGLRSAIRGG